MILVKMYMKAHGIQLTGQYYLRGKMKYHTIIDVHKNVHNSYNFNIFCTIISKEVKLKEKDTVY